jgi:hypothetical protein
MACDAASIRIPRAIRPQSKEPAMSDAGKRLPAMRPDECSRDCDVACRHREGAMGALATIMAD